MPVQMELARILIRETSDTHVVELREVGGDRIFAIEIGLYDQATGKRVPLPDGSDHLLLPTKVIIRK